MAYNPSVYNMYGYQPQVPQQPINGLAFIDDPSVLDTLKMPPGSTSQPYFLKDENKFYIVTFDNVGGCTKELFSFEKVPIQKEPDPNQFVTRDYLDEKINSIMEALNGKHALQQTAEQAE